MEEVCDVGPTNLRKYFRVEELEHEMFLVISRCRKTLVMSTPKPDNFRRLFWTFAVAPVWLKFFLCVRNLDEYFTKFIPSKFLNFLPCLTFYCIAGQKVKMKEYL